MKVLHLPVGKQMIGMCKSLREIGVQATSCHFRQRDLSFKPDLCLHLEQLSGAQRRKRRQEFLAEAVKHYDIFHFHFGETFLKDRSDLEFLKRHGKKLIVQHRGSDVRMLSIARRFNNPYVRVKSGRRRRESSIKKKLSELSAYIDHAIVADHELLSYIDGRYKHIHLLRQFIDIDKFQTVYPSLQTKPPLIVHAPTNTYLKGTEYLLKAVEELQRSGVKFKFQIIENMSHREATRIYKKADIVVDQLLQGSFGVLSLEGMALGKAVVCFIRDDLARTYPPNLPIINANRATVAKVLRRLIESPKRRRRIGKAGRRYIENYYDSRILAKQLKDIYKKL